MHMTCLPERVTSKYGFAVTVEDWIMFRMKNSLYPIILSGLLVTSCQNEQRPIVTPDTLASVTLADGDLNDLFECLEADGVTLVAAHRGGTLENSITGMTQVLGSVPAIMEVDVNRAADGVLFLMHDDTLERTTTGTGDVANRDWSYISTLNVEDLDGRSYPEAPPTLAEALAWAGGKTILELDIKRGVPFQDVVASVKDAGATGRILYIAYSADQARLFHRLHPEAMISASLFDTGDLSELVASGIPADRLLGWTGNRDPNQMVFDELNDADVEVIFGTLGGADSIDNRIAASGEETYYPALAGNGVDIIATDRPVEAFEAMKKAGLNVSSPACGVSEAG